MVVGREVVLRSNGRPVMGMDRGTVKRPTDNLGRSLISQ